ncbi:hypothetical protein BXZ70DRAFT_925031 [Cristinia sonorae]|uniref:C2H2-type domain-containing protein n=1 Tax=Cristinia sonorae TaxID=1940300 RepID=A0A8K0XS16_9AGAR|nr:hypothetical protein BXZ70DRAFT_925031 [Cristinia sonorae]
MADAAHTSLLSLSVAAANAQRIPVDTTYDSPPAAAVAASSLNGTPTHHHHNHHHNNNNTSSVSVGSTGKLHASMKHRRLSSTGMARRRLSDAKEAASRPSPVFISTAASALTSLATLSLSTSAPTSSLAEDAVMKSEVDGGETDDGGAQQQPTTTELSAGGIAIKNGKKRGMIFKCESCSKVYRHPSCLIKHRWEHSPHWREASKFLLSKHQQVQLLEAAAILSHLSPSASGGTSLPEDRSLWPSFLSGGALPPPSTATSPSGAAKKSPGSSSLDARPAFPTSSSLPGHSVTLPPSRPLSTGPRLHDYSIPSSGGVTHVRPGVLGIPTGSEVQDAATLSRPVPVPVSNGVYRDTVHGHSYTSDPWGSPVSLTYGSGQSPFHSSSVQSYGTGGGWSLPRSSVRSVSVTSGSRSRSGSVPKSDMEDEGEGEEYVIDVEVDGESEYGGFAARGRTSAARGAWRDELMYEGKAGKTGRDAKIEEEEWDGMEMEMEM